MIQIIMKTPASHPRHHTVGRTFYAWDGHRYYCDSWEFGRGYWMTRVSADPEPFVDTPSRFRRSVPERAIGRNFLLASGQTNAQSTH